MAELPTGTVTFLFTDLEGSTRLWEEHPDEMKAALARHDEIVRGAIEGHGGHVVKTTGDGAHAAFATAEAAVRAALGAQLALRDEAWPDATGALRVRMGLHTGSAELRDGDYYGSAANRAARVMAVAHGGQVLCSQATADLVRDALAEGMGLVDLGEHRLRDLSRPERVFQMSVVGLPAEFGPLRSLDTLPGNLPVQLSSFVGRDQEIERITTAFDGARVVTITGVGGVGKTRLAVQVAAELLPRYEHGAWLCELAAATDADTMTQLVAATVGVRPRPETTLEGSILEYLRGRTLLLVLDNCEHLLDAAGRLAEAIVRECADVQVLATSREGLAVEGERVWPLRSLALPDTGPAAPDTSAAAASAAVQLFVDRAAAARPGFALDGTNAPVVVDICRRLDGMPLAIELAAARVVAMSPAEIAGLLDERFRLLTGGRRTAVERHQTLRATVDWSYSMLSDVEQRVFDRLGVFSGTFDTLAATHVVAGDGVEVWGVIDALASLVSKSMIVADETADGTTRYSMLETLRQYARERLEDTDEADAWRRRHAEHYASVAEEAGPALYGPDEIVRRRRLHADLDNLRAAVMWGVDGRTDGDGDLAVRIIAALVNEATLSRASGIGTWAARVLPATARSSAPLRTGVYAAAAWQEINRGDLERGLTLARQGLDALTPESTGIGSLYSALAYIAANESQFEEVRRLYAEASSKLDADPPAMRSMMRSTYSMFEAAAGDLQTARAAADDAIALAQATHNPSSLAMALYASGWATAIDEPAHARRVFEESVALCHAGACDAVYVAALSRMAPLVLVDGDARGAITALRESVRYTYDNGDRASLVYVVDIAARVLTMLGRDEDGIVLAGVSEGDVVARIGGLLGAERVLRTQSFDSAKARIGGPVFERALSVGRAMSYEEAIDFVLGALDRAEEALDGADGG